MSSVASATAADPARGALPSRGVRGWVRAAVLFLFFASGTAGLIYEVVWTRLLTYRFGATLDAVTAILVSFMGGLALGAWLLGRYADRVRRPLALYGVLEILIGLSALLLPLLLELLTPLYRWIVSSTEHAFLARRLLRFALTSLLILVPTTAMGGTLPVLSRFLARSSDRLGVSVGSLYGLNTLGAVTGAFLSGFFLIVALGIRGTLGLAVALNITVGIVSLLLSRALAEERAFEEPADEPAAVAAPTSPAPAPAPAPAAPALAGSATSPDKARLILWVYAVSGLVALAYQVVWFRALVFNFEYLKNTTYSFSAMLTVFLVGIALGSVAMTPLADRLKRPFLAFGLLEIAIGLAGLFSFLAIYHNFGDPQRYLLDAEGKISWFEVTSLLFAKTAVALGPATFCMGMLFPVAVRCYVGRVHGVAGAVGRLYAFNTVGAIFGAFVASFILVPALGVGWGTIFLSAIGLLLGALVVWRAAETDTRRRLILATLPAVFAVVLMVRMVPMSFPIQMQSIDEFERIVYYADGPLATISVVENSKRERTIYVDNVGVAGTDPILLTDQKSLAHVGMLFIPEPRRVLTVGFGSGGASYSFTTYPELEAVHCVEIDPTVPRAAATLTASNWGVLAPKFAMPGGGEQFLLPEAVRDRQQREGRSYVKEVPAVWDWLAAEMSTDLPPGAEPLEYYTNDARYELILDDARELLQSTATVYDVIATDCTDLRYKTNANLYDLEYFRACRERLSDQGLVVVWMPLGGLSQEMFAVALRTFREVFPEMAVWYMNNEPTHYCLLLGWKQPLQIDLERLERRLAIEAVGRDLRELSLDSAAKILSCYVTDHRGLEAMLGRGALNTENEPILEFQSPKYGYGDKPLIDNLFDLAEHRNDVMDYVTGTPEALAAMRAELEQYEAAEMPILRGHRNYRNIELSQACAEYLRAKEAAPQDRSIDAMLEFREIKLLADHTNSPFYRLQLGLLYKQQRLEGDALTYLEPLEGLVLPDKQAAPESYERLLKIKGRAMSAAARIYERNGQDERAQKLLAKVVALGLTPEE